MTLSELLTGMEPDCTLAAGTAATDITGVEYDSRKVRPGSLFVAVEGLVADGHQFIESACQSGALAVAVNAARAESIRVPEHVAVIACADTRRALSRLACRFFGDVSKRIPVVGITGTNGKTSTAYMMEAILTDLGYKVGVMGTVNYRWPGTVVEAPNTTPESRDIHEMLHRMYADGVNAVVMEVSSHGLALGRVDDLTFTGAVFTNLTRDHMDFHNSFEEYFAAKRKLFELVNASDAPCRFGVINLDDPWGRIILSEHYDYHLFSFGMNDAADYHPVKETLSLSIRGSSFTLHYPCADVPVTLAVGSRFSVYNAIAAFAAVHQMEFNPWKVAKGLEKLKNIPGRFQSAIAPAGFAVIVDYAHTDDAMEKLLLSVKELSPKRIITVFGCGGDRDRTKRPLMGDAAGRHSDTVIVTSDNPRTEDPQMIIDDILAGMTAHRGKTEVIPDRAAAIERAVSIAADGDIVVIAGKGHENYQIIGKEKHHFDDMETAERAIAAREGQ